MPVIYVHGVNTRDDYKYRSRCAARDKLLKRFVLTPLAEKDERFANMKISNPYWGNCGVNFRWGQASLPIINVIEDLGSGYEETLESDIEFIETVEALASLDSERSSRIESLGGDKGIFQRAAERDLHRFIEAVLSPVLLGETPMLENAREEPEGEGIVQALLTIASESVASDPYVETEVTAASSDEEVMDLLIEKLVSRYEQLVTTDVTDQPDAQIESLGADGIWEVKDRLVELFDRAKDAPLRVATLPVLALTRNGIHRNFSRFLGDVFVYLNDRGDATQPGCIVSTVLNAITTAPKFHDNEPLIVISHSMGGNILYDILTYYAPSLEIDVWISVGGQVGHFEEMKLFKISDKTIGKPQKVTCLKPRVGYWLNIYDPADCFSFKVAPVFDDVDADESYLTGASILNAHNAYFSRENFYHLMREHIEKACYDVTLR